ncbi:thiamine pyrophosphate-binding protein [Pollutimonas harenae]|uniref:Thiamine pyrophosphate-binding protein n=1 Tax=Pollutimonas harenae TaxID=657015 RepID=A0A853GX24_9BURK|nr:thiamine pyrophosphate-binding protein [Pollutimonas harenae]NYT84320.1 thiamine pyrophosphate-binding protein [Pollutimonas harenae]TEA73278.1 thiamine pyrophosphate-binding protein [Pollutimonas harenae]
MTTHQKHLLSGGAAVAEMLRRYEVGPLFGMGGFQLLPFYEACRKLGLRHTLINDERCGVFAADAYARVSNRVGVVDATLGPGATNLVTGLAESFNAGIPIVAIVADAHRDHAWKNMTQEARQLEVLRPVCKEVIRVEAIQRIPEHVRRAFAVATSGRPGPVVIAIPEDISHGEHEFDDADLFTDPATAVFQSRRTRPDGRDVAQAAALIAGAERPLLLVGGGIHISQASDALLALARQEGVPVAHSMSGKGAIACTDPLSAGVFGRYDRIANDLIAASDCLIVVGCKLGEVATKRFTVIPPATPLIHIDVQAEEIGRTTKADIALVGDARLALEDIAAALGDGRQRLAARADYLAEIPVKMAKWNETAKDRTTSKETPVNIGRIMGELNRSLPDDAVLVADGGFAAHWGALLFDTKKAGRHFVADRGFASIGYGLPGGMGAKIGVGSDRVVVALTGDGGFNMTMGELETAKRLGVSFVLCIFNNAASGYVKALQHSVYGAGNYQSSDLHEMNYANIANNMGCLGIRVEDPEDLAAAFEKGFANKVSPTVLDIVVTRDPARMLPAVDNRILKVNKGDRPV